MRQYAGFYGQPGSRGYRWQSLSKACTQQKIPVVAAHDALGDCRLTLALLQAMAKEE